MSRKTVRAPLAATAALAAATGMCLWGCIETYGVETAYQSQNRDPYMISAQFTRLAGVAAAVPESATLGYLTDAAAGSVTASAMRTAAQYVLAPRLLADGTGHDWVLGNFTRPADFAALGRAQGLRVRQDFGNGVVLYRREGGR